MQVISKEQQKRTLFLPDDGIPVSLANAVNLTAIAPYESQVIIHDHVPDDAGGLRIAEVYGIASDSIPHPGTELRIHLGTRNLAALPQVPFPGLFSISFSLGISPTPFPVYWIVPPGVDFDVTLYVTIASNLSGWTWIGLYGWIF